MPDINIEDRVSQALRHLRPEDVSSVQRALALLAEDPFSESLHAHRLTGKPEVFVLRASDRLRLIYRIESHGRQIDRAPVTVVVEDITSTETLKQHF